MTFATSLFGSQFGGQGAPNGFGNGYITFNPALSQATVSLNVNGIGANITGAGLFNGTAGGSLSNALLALTDQNNLFENGSFSRTFTVPMTLIQQVLSNPRGYSFGVSTAELPNGALSGTLTPTQTFGGTFSAGNVAGAEGFQNGGGAFTAEITQDESGSNFLNYTFMPTGIGSTFTSLSLNQGITGQNGPVFLNLANGGALTNGMYKSSVIMTTAQTQQLVSNPSGYYVTATSTANPNGANAAIRAQFGTTQDDQWLPIVGRAAGAAGTQWATDVNLFNTSWTSPATVVLQYVASGENNLGSTGAFSAGNATTVTIPPRGTTFVAAVLNTLWQMNSGLGSLRITSDHAVVATARIYNDQRSSGRGSLGQLVNSVTLCDATTVGALPGVYGSIPSSAASALQRTNIGLFNPNSSTVTVNLYLTNRQGTSAANATSLTLRPYSVVQLPLTGAAGTAALFNPTTDVDAGTVTFTASAAIVGFASLVDADSGDTSMIFAKPDMAAGAPMSLSDAAGFLAAANQGEVQAGQLALNRASATAVKNFAQQMVADHSSSLTQAQSLFASLGITASMTGPTTSFLISKNEQTMATLTAAGSGHAFDRAYMQGQIQMHQLVLANLDTLLSLSSQNPQVAQFLEGQRASVASHLTLAQQILLGL